MRHQPTKKEQTHGIQHRIRPSNISNIASASSKHYFSSNCYPPIPQIWVEQAIEAIFECANDEPETLVDLPEGVTTRDGQTYAPAGFIVNSLRLDAFVDALYEGDN